MAKAHAFEAHAFQATVRKVDINPYVRVPAAVVKALLSGSGRTAAPIPVTGSLQGKPFAANVVRFRGLWRLYLNGVMRKAAAFDALPPYRRKEILRYLGRLKGEATLARNVAKAVAYLRGEKIAGLVAVTR